MNTFLQTDAWIYRIVLVLVLMLVGSLAGIIVMTLMKRPIPELLFVLRSVAIGGLARLLVPSPLNRGLFD